MAIERVVILGGGTAGWLSAAMIAARRPELSVTLVEAPDIPTIGVGEGTWPTMRSTLATIGIEEKEFLRACDASFKQGSRFDGWVSGTSADRYYHPFSAPSEADMRESLLAWARMAARGGQAADFAEWMSPQPALCARDLAPRQPQMPPYAGAVNYAYHLDAGKFAGLLMRHATQRLGVCHLKAHVDKAARDPQSGDIEALECRDGARILGDFFIDCSGQSARLIAGELGVPWVDLRWASFNDSALAIQLPHWPGAAIASQTIAHAHQAGWIWDIALPTRRGIGCVYSSNHIDDERALDVLRNYCAQEGLISAQEDFAPRKLRFEPGHRETFWAGNCLAIGLSAGFIEPLEASAIVLIELSLKALCDNFPRSRASMDIHARRFNELFRYRWERIVDFLKLHYVLSRRDEPYWQAQRDPSSMSTRLIEQLALWREQPPSQWDFPQIDEIFPAASHQYILYGMGFAPPRGLAGNPSERALAQLGALRQKTRALCASLPTNRAYFDRLGQTAGEAKHANHTHQSG